MTEALNRKVSCKHDADLLADRLGGDIAHIHAVNFDRAMRHIVEARQQVDDGGLARARWTDDGNGLPRFCGEGNFLQDRHAVFVFMRDFVELNLAFDLGHRFGFGLVNHGGFFIENGKDAFRACDGILDICPQHGDLLDGLVEALHVGEEGDDQTQCDSCAKECSRLSAGTSRPRL